MTRLLTLLKGILSAPVSRILLGSVIGQGAVLLSSPFLTRIYGPDAFGGLAVITSIVGILGGLATMAWDRAIVVPADDGSARNLVRLGLLSVAGVGILVALVFYLASAPLSVLLSWPELAEFWWIVPITVAAVGCYSVASSWLVRGQRYDGLAVRNLTQGLTQAASSLLLGIVGWIPGGLLVSLGVGRLAGLVGIGLNRRRGAAEDAAPPLRETASRFRRFPLITAWSGLANAIGLQLPLLLMAGAYGTAQIGLYALTIRVIASPIGLVVDATSQYFEGRFARQARESARQSWPLLRSTVVRLLAAGVVPAALLLVAGPPLFGWVFGSQWRDAGTFAQVLAVMYLAQFAIVPISRTLTILELQGRQFVWDVGRAVATCVGVAVAAALGAPLVVTVLVFGAVQLVFYVVMFAMCRTAAKQADEKGTTLPAAHETNELTDPDTGLTVQD